MAEDSRSLALESLSDLLITGKYSDLEIHCGEDVYKVHKAIVCSRAGFFEAAIRFGGQESNENVINLSEDDPIVLRLLIQYLYDADYDPVGPATAALNVLHSGLSTAPFPHTCNYYCNSRLCKHHTCSTHRPNYCSAFTCRICFPQYVPLPAINGSSEQLLFHAKMYELADKYDVVGLKDLCKAKFGLACAHFWNDIQFSEAANYAFSTTPENDKGLRDIVVKAISNHIELLDKPEIEALVTEFNGLAYGLLKEKAEEIGWKKEKARLGSCIDGELEFEEDQ